MIDETILTEARSLALQIAPELSSQELYVINRPPEYEIDGIRGVAVIGPCPLIRKLLEADGRWRGVGPSIVIVNQELSREQVLSVLIHEVGHLLPFREIKDVAATPAAVADCEREISEWRTDSLLENPDLPPWHPHHDRAWHLRVLHLWWRASLAGEVLFPLDDLGAFDPFQMHPTFMYLKRFGSAGVRMQSLTFDEIQEAEAPPDFLELWRHDVRVWMKANEAAVNKVMESAA